MTSDWFIIHEASYALKKARTLLEEDAQEHDVIVCILQAKDEIAKLEELLL